MSDNRICEDCNELVGAGFLHHCQAPTPRPAGKTTEQKRGHKLAVPADPELSPCAKDCWCRVKDNAAETAARIEAWIDENWVDLKSSVMPAAIIGAKLREELGRSR